MSLRRHMPFISRVTLVLLLIYTQVLGATSRGILLPEARNLTLWILVLVVAGWLLARWRLHWHWHHSALDWMAGIWGLALLLSFFGNLADARAILIALWYAGIYIAIAYVLLDLLTNRVITRENLVNIFLLTGVLVIVFGYIQVYIEFTAYGLLDVWGTFTVCSLFVNANALATYLIIYLIFLLGQIAQRHSLFMGVLLITYWGLCAFLMFLTMSRGAWLALVAGLVVWLILRGVQSVNDVLAWWQHLN